MSLQSREIMLTLEQEYSSREDKCGVQSIAKELLTCIFVPIIQLSVVINQCHYNCGKLPRMAKETQD